MQCFANILCKDNNYITQLMSDRECSDILFCSVKLKFNKEAKVEIGFSGEY